MTNSRLIARKKELKKNKQKDSRALFILRQAVPQLLKKPEVLCRRSFKEVLSKMKAYGENILDKKIIEKILISTPHKYAFVTIIKQIKDYQPYR
ncbi:hypothetical protein CR513_50329, partial [Mucuna pruriens]